MTEHELPYGDVPGQTHWDGCWRARGHHNCAVREIERLRAAPRSGVGCWVAREDPRLGADAKPDPYKRVILSRDLGDLLNLAPGECARVRITREEA